MRFLVFIQEIIGGRTMDSKVEYIQTETGLVPKDLMDTINIKKYIEHQIDVITDSEWFEDLVERKAKELLSKEVL
jgi:hypothetical protein